MDQKRIMDLIAWWKETDTQGVDVEKHLINPLMEAFGEDVNEILSYLAGMSEEDLKVISGCFEDIYRKFQTDDVFNALEDLESKIA